ncbi:MAG: hypothetical protein J4F31_00560 [Flavobacteriales bacterium]|nr:hypothetical protein [Flavobacteriales bacterium]
MATKRTIIRAIFIVLVLTGCQNEEIGPQSTIEEGSGVFAFDDGVLIGNEGTFNFGNASLSYYQPFDKTSASEIFETTNDLPLGDVLQSVYEDENDLYLVVNNSSRIAVVNPATMRLRRDFQNLGSPRYMVRKDDRIFVSQLFDSHLWVINTETGEVLDKWETPGWTERMVLVDSILWVEDQVNGDLLGFDLRGDSLRHQIDLPGGVSDLLLAAGRMYALTHASIGSDLVEINASNGFVMRTHDFGPRDASHLHFVTNEDAFYFWSNAEIYKFRRNDWIFQPNAMCSTGAANVGTIYRDPLLGDWYYTDVLDFATRGRLHHLDPFFDPVDTARVGFIPKILLRPGH